MSSVVSGFAWGTGTTIARNLFSSSPEPAYSQKQSMSEEYEKCLIDSQGDAAACKHLKQ